GRLAPAILVGYLAATALNDSPHPVWAVVLLGVGNTIAAWVGAWGLRRSGFGSGMETFRDVLMLVAAALTTAAVAASIATPTLAATPGFDMAHVAWLWRHWFLGDLTGMLVVTSLLLAWSHPGTARPRGWWAQFAACVALTVMLGSMVFLPSGESRSFTFITFCPLIWAALALRLQGAMVVVLVLATIGVIGTTTGAGPFAYAQGDRRFIDLQLFLAVVSTATLVLAVVADERRAQRAIMQSEARLRLALEASHTGLWKLELPDGAMTFSPECRQVTGLDAAEFGSSSAGFMSLVHDDDRAAVRAAFRDALHGRGLFESAFRLVRPDGQEVWLEVRARAMVDDTGRATRVLGTVTDITERKHDERRLAEQARLLDLATDAIIIRDLGGRIAYWNHGAMEMFGYSRDEALGRSVGELLHTEYPEPLERIHEALLRNDRWSGELVNAARDGTKKVMHARWVLNRDAHGQPASVLQTHTDITERKRVEATARFLVDIDRVIANATTAEEIASTCL
ncbi:MAG TPA: PAS domain S-box protein, partial [Lysobacter sp.]